MFALGALFHGGHDVAPDPEMAQRWFRAAAERGHPRAQLMLGRYLMRGTAGRAIMPKRGSGLRAEGQGVTEATLELTRLQKDPSAEPRDAEGSASAA